MLTELIPKVTNANGTRRTPILAEPLIPRTLRLQINAPSVMEDSRRSVLKVMLLLPMLVAMAAIGMIKTISTVAITTLMTLRLKRLAVVATVEIGHSDAFLTRVLILEATLANGMPKMTILAETGILTLSKLRMLAAGATEETGSETKKDFEATHECIKRET